MKSAAAIGFDCRPSRSLAACIALVWLSAVLALALCGLPLWAKLALAVVANGYAWWALRYFLRSPWQHLHWHEAGHWRVRDDEGSEHVAELQHATVLGGLIVLSFRVTSIGKMAIVLSADNCDGDTRRRLRVRLSRVRTRDDQST